MTSPTPAARTPYLGVEPPTTGTGSLTIPGMLICNACSLGRASNSACHRVVPGYGSWPSKLMFIAQSPGEEEDRQGKPLIGRSGQLFTDLLRECKINPEKIYKTNVNHCHPPMNRKATKTEMDTCTDLWLFNEITRVNPDVIVTLGDTAFKALLPTEKSSITQIRGNVFEREISGRKRYVIPTVHPAFVARNEPAYRPWLTEDIMTARSILTGEYHKPAELAQSNPARGPWRTTEASWDEILEVAYDPDKRTYGLDLETVGVHRNSRILSVGLCNTYGNGLVYFFEDDEDATAKMAQLKESLEDPTRHKVVSNAKFERELLSPELVPLSYTLKDISNLVAEDYWLINSRYNITIVNYDDTLIMAWLLGNFPLSLKDGIHRAYGIEMIHFDDAFRTYKSKDWRGENQPDMGLAIESDPDLAVRYSAQDPDASLRLFNFLEPALREQNLWDLYTNVEKPFIEAIIGMELIGMGFDGSRLAEARIQLADSLVNAEVRLTALAGKKFNPGSWQQTMEVLYGYSASKKAGVVRGPIPVTHPYKVTPTPKQLKAYWQGESLPTDKVGLGDHIENPLVREILTHRAIKKMFGTYIDGLPTYVEPDGRIHANIKQTGTETGRVSVADPNLTNIPSREREDVKIGVDGATIRRAFIPAPGNVISAPDLSQIEMRIAADRSGDVNMIRLLTDPDGDLHGNTTFGIYGKREDEVSEYEWKNMRYLAKTIGFGTLYGLSASGLLRRTPTLDLTMAEASDFIRKFYETYPALYEWQERVKQFTRDHGYAETILGRRRYLPDITASDRTFRGEAERAAINVPVQGSAADYFKTCIVRVGEALKRERFVTRMINQVHDEIVLEGPLEEIPALAELVVPIMSNAIPLAVPVRVDMEWGYSWGDLKKYKPEAFKAV